MNAHVVQMGSKPRKEGRCCKDVAVHQNSAKDDDHDHAAATIAAAQHCSSSSQAGREGRREASKQAGEMIGLATRDAAGWLAVLCRQFLKMWQSSKGRFSQIWLKPQYGNLVIFLTFFPISGY
jgi:hypothetical protein